MKRTLAVKKGEGQLRVELDRLDAKYRKVKTLLAQALLHRRRFEQFEQAVKAVAIRDGTCWCGVKVVEMAFAADGKKHFLHTEACDGLFVVLYGGEREQNGE